MCGTILRQALFEGCIVNGGGCGIDLRFWWWRQYDWLDPLNGDRAPTFFVGGGFEDVFSRNDNCGFDRRVWWWRSIRYVA
jgi:hypothetical protein